MIPFTKGVHDIGGGSFVYLQPDGSWGFSNAGLVTDAGRSLLVDTLFDLRLTAEMLAELRRVAPAAASIDVLVNTHSNGDHTFGNRLVEGARIVASRRCAEEMRDVGPDRLAELMGRARAGDLGRTGEYLQRIFGRFDFAGVDRYVLPTETFDGSLELVVGDKSVRLIEVGPAHTGGDVVVHVPANRVVYTADILFIGGHPVAWAGPVANWIAAIDLVLGLDAEVIVPGHGPIPTREQILDLRGYWDHVLRECRARFEAGVPAWETACDLAAGPYADWGDAERLVVNVDTIYRELGDHAAGPPGPVERFGRMAAFEEALRAAARLK